MPELEAINKLYLELSQFATAKTARELQLEQALADATSGLRYIEQSYGRLYGVGWDRVYEATDRLLGSPRENI